MQKEEEIFTVNEDIGLYGVNNLIYRDEVYAFISCCFELHKKLGRGFLEAVYKDALCYELEQRNIPFEKEKKFEIEYKDIILPHFYYCDIIIYDKSIVEIKAQEGINDSYYKQLINYLAVSYSKLGLLVNFGEDSLKFKRVVL
ncbi:MAG: GxxExxY protein [Bacteroidota bacterium]|nr:GxxExxY protein [Bacteroidota bacterium]